MGRDQAALELLAKPAAAGSAPDRIERARIAAGASPPRLRSEMEGAAIGLTTLASLLIGQVPADLATPYLTWALALDPTLDAARLTFVELLQNDQDLRGPSRAAVLSILDGISPSSAYAGLAEVQRAFILRDMGRTDEAIAAAQSSGGVDDPVTVRALADLYRGAERYAEAEAMFDLLVKQAGDTPDWRLLFTRGAMRERVSRWSEAEADLKHALALSPDQPEVMNYLAYAWIERGERADEALALLHRAVGLQPNSGHIIDSLGWAYFQRGDYEAALIHLERAIELEPDNYEVNDHLGDLYWRLGRKREARFQWSRALTMKLDEKSAARISAKVSAGLPSPPKAPPLARAQ
jgi:Flp pilus assembly protein TadD